MGNTWAPTSDWETICRRASGRRRYNAVRQVQASVRRHKVAELLWNYPSIFAYGLQADIARKLGVSPSTICRDIQKILDELNWGYCPLCGTWVHKPIPEAEDE